MPRVATALLRKAFKIDPLLPALLAPCRDLHAAQNELRWLREHVDKVTRARRVHQNVASRKAFLRQLVIERAKGKPLQYILGTEYFGDLEIRCRPGVLIPRQETAASVTHLTRLLRKAPNLPSELRLLDLCTGTGCIPLLFQHEMSSRNNVNLRILGVDISKRALSLAEHNKKRIYKSVGWQDGHDVQFIDADILLSHFADRDDEHLPLMSALNLEHLPQSWDILISNPPYISPSQYWKSTTRSVRNFEPKLALVPRGNEVYDDVKHGDMFYPALLRIAYNVEAKVVLLEVADMAQAVRVAQAARDLDIFHGIEIWRDEPGSNTKSMSEERNGFPVIGEGKGRSVVCYRGLGAMWLGKSEAVAANGRHYNEVAL